MSAPDWLVALDDAFTARLRHGTVCGRRTLEVYCDVWASAELQQAMGIGVCPACHATRAWRQAVEAVMPEFEEPRHTSASSRRQNKENQEELRLFCHQT
jgi:hypothetical protein